MKIKYYTLTKEEKKQAKENYYKTAEGNNTRLLIRRASVYGLLLLVFGVFLLVYGLVNKESLLSILYAVTIIIIAIIFFISSYVILIRKINNHLVTNKKKTKKK